MARNLDKIQLPTNITDIAMLSVLLRAVKNNEPLTTQDSKAIFEEAKKDGKRKKKSNGDTHTEKALYTYGLIKYISGLKDCFVVTPLGDELLSIYDDAGNLVCDEITFVKTTLKVFAAWHADNKGRDIHPGQIILKLLYDNEINGYLTEHEIAHFVYNSAFKTDNQFNEIRDYILKFRTNSLASPYTKTTKSYIFLPSLVNNWHILEKASVETLGLLADGSVSIVNDVISVVNTEPIAESIDADDVSESNMEEFDTTVLTEENMYKNLTKYKLSEQAKRIIAEEIKSYSTADIVSTPNPTSFTPEWFIEKSKEYPELDAEAERELVVFQNKFSPERLSELAGKEMLNTIFLNAENKENLCRIMEYDAKNKELFGSIAGGYSHKYGLFFSGDGQWMIRTGRKTKAVSEEEAIEIGTKIRDCLVSGAKIIKQCTQLKTIEDYKELYTILKQETDSHIDRAWFMKYYYMLFPELLASDYSDSAQRTVLSTLKIEQEKYPFVRMGQIKLFTDSCGISNVMFNKIFWNNYDEKLFSDVTRTEIPTIPVYADKINENLSAEELGKILSNMYNSATNKPAGIHMFGIKYGKVIEDQNYSIVEIVTASGLPASYKEEVRKGIKIYDSILNNEFGISFSDEQVQSTEASDIKSLPVRSHNTRRIHPLNRILYGAPGTGKTYSTAQYAISIIDGKSIDELSLKSRNSIMARYNELIDSKHIVFTTFHQNYGYEDFIQGIRPDVSKGGMNFKTVDGMFKKISWTAMQHPEDDYVIIIDEINRANISKVFGELITLIEEDKRWGEENAVSVILPSGELFAVPNNLYILGTMNSADKSISLIDAALRRRFQFVEFEPKLDLIADIKLRDVLEKLNKGISDELHSTDLLVGHSYFIDKTVADICDIMNHSIIPLLYEYFLDNKHKVQAQLKTALDGLSIDISVSSMGRIKIKKKDEQ